MAVILYWIGFCITLLGVIYYAAQQKVKGDDDLEGIFFFGVGVIAFWPIALAMYSTFIVISWLFNYFVGHITKTRKKDD